MTTIPVTDPTIADLITHLASLQAAKADLVEREDHLKAQLREALPEPGEYRYGGLQVSLQRNRRFNPDAARPLLSDADLAACTVPTLDAKAVKARLTPLQVEDCMKTVGDHRVVLR